MQSLFAEPSPSPSASPSPKPTTEPVNQAYEGPSGAVPAGNANANGQNKSGDIVNTWDFIQMILVLAVVVGVIYLIFFLLKRGMGKKVAENDLIKVLGSRVLSGTKSLHLVEVGGAIYLVGAANDSVNLVAEVTEKEAKDALRLAAAKVTGFGKPRFFDALMTLFKPGAKKQLEINESLDFMKKQRDRLKKFKP